MIITPPNTPHTLFFIYIPHTSTIFTKGYFTKSAHIALSVIKMNCWCAWVQLHKCAKSDSTLPISQRMPSLKRLLLSLMHSHRVQSWQRNATLKWSRAWTPVKPPRSVCKSQHRPVVRSVIIPALDENHCHSFFVAFKEVFCCWFFFLNFF